MAEVQGICDARFEAVRDVLAASLDDKDVGASVAVYLGDEPVVDLWGGYSDAARTRSWESDTITCVFSTTKTMAALCALILADRGVVDLDAPVVEYWPEFGALGKDKVLVRHVLGHTAGLPTWQEKLRAEQLFDWPLMTRLLAEQELGSEPGVVGAYHSITQGYLIGEVVRRTTGRSLGAFFAEEVAGPLEADFHLELAPEHDHRVAPVIPATTRAAKLAALGAGNPEIPAELANTEAWRRADIPSAGGFGNARSVAAVQSVLACGGEARGVRLLSEAGCERVLEQQFFGEDAVLGRTIRYGMGYGLMQARTCSWGGWGGSLVLVDLEKQLTVAYVMNQMLEEGPLGDDRGLGILLATYEGLT
ncbi:serine hydrolase domain-containing protein [Streptomyces sp. SID13031]|uniref:serine hydrolase domain-containing protein n=1 Tax=Streptomyces sp. SID13031 TaxID=2706046 RepID=UPI0013C7D98C|nr:serine hydrolase domain-containing protein [Streptomyces sp. SID13031]NEA34643.1 beta-lactamase family protein [Streptomyces sp. SID13031]